MICFGAVAAATAQKEDQYNPHTTLKPVPQQRQVAVTV
jgi:hypothetical protein